MTLEEFSKGIGLDKEVIEFIKNNLFSVEKYKKYDEAFKGEEEKFLNMIKGDENKAKLALIFYVMKAESLFYEFREEGVSKEIFFNTFSDITIWSNRYKKNTGKIGIEEVKWLLLHLKMKLFRLGRLQFEIAVLDKDIIFKEANYSKGEKILKIHIPEGEPLNRDECIKAFLKAKQFFGAKYKIFTCESWLLSPNLKEILNEESNIIKFQSFFYIYDIVYTFRQAEARIFGRILENKKQYEENTTLQRKAKEYLLTHEDIGIGVGIMEAASIE